MRELGAELGQLGHRVGGKTGLRDGDLATLDLLGRKGAMSPSALARAMQMHPATMTGVLDRLEADGWIARERDPGDRRAVLIRIAPSRAREMSGHYAGMNGAIDKIAASYRAEELEAIIDFLQRLVEAGREENLRLADQAK
jgi:DNA-binding MarR family transcriptional regulator